MVYIKFPNSLFNCSFGFIIVPEDFRVFLNLNGKIFFKLLSELSG